MLIYLTASIICAVFGAVYEMFSHGVYSFYMIYAFAFPLICGMLPFLLLSFSLGNLSPSERERREQSLNELKGDGKYSWKKEGQKRQFLLRYYPGNTARNLYHSAVIVWTVGCIMNGVLEIYGTTNRLLGIYWLAGAILMFASIVTYLLSLIKNRKKVPACIGSKM